MHNDPPRYFGRYDLPPKGYPRPKPNPIDQALTDALAKEIANEIDREILENMKKIIDRDDGFE